MNDEVADEIACSVNREQDNRKPPGPMASLKQGTRGGKCRAAQGKQKNPEIRLIE
jgi:hypothetical protein